MTINIIITFCILILLAYIFDLSSSRTRIPSVILLLLLGWTTNQVSILLKITLPDFSPLLPVIGTIGLILIVLEGSLELRLNHSKRVVILKSLSGAIFSIISLAFILTYVLSQNSPQSFRILIINALPLCIISSAIAIPSASHLSKRIKEFIIYESSFSDIIGVVLFNFFITNEILNAQAFANFFFFLLLITAISLISTIGLSLLLSRINHHIKYIPIILIVILIYSISKIYHLPGLVFILMFGLFLGNLDKIKNKKWSKRFHPEILEKEVAKLRELTAEGSFLVRALFFLLFGYLIEIQQVLNKETLPWSTGLVVIILILRSLQIKISGLQLSPLLWIAPRGLITILLFLSMDASMAVTLVTKSLIIQVILLTSVVMAIGLITTKNSTAEIHKQSV